MKPKIIREENLKLHGDEIQKISIVDNKKNPLFARKDIIYADEEFWRSLKRKERISGIYHERGHITKIGRRFINFSNFLPK